MKKYKFHYWPEVAEVEPIDEIMEFNDDKQIVDLKVEKYYSEEPRVEVALEEIG